MKNYNISEIEKIEPYDNNGTPILLIFIKSSRYAIYAGYVEFDHENNTFTPYNYN